MANPFPFVRIEGAPRDRGRSYGRQAGDRVQVSLDIYLPAFAEQAKLEWPQVKALARRFGQNITSFDPSIMDEIEGIAEGAEQEVEAIIALNARTELLYWSPGPENQLGDEGCTAAVCLPEVTANNHLLQGQNWDWRPACRDSAVVLAVHPPKGPAILTFVEAGILARSGMNSAGIGVVANFLQSDQDFGRKGVPIPFIRRRILSSDRLAPAVGEVLNAPRAFSSNYLIADAGGEAIDLETAPDEVFPLFAEEGILVHSNHFRSPAANAKLRDTGVSHWPDSLYRDRRLLRYLAPRRGKITVEDLQAAFRDHFGLPDAVCRHPAQRGGGAVTSTVASIVMDLADRRMWVAPGPVCENDYTEYRLD